LTGLTGSIALELFEDSEFADATASVNYGVILEIPEIQTIMVGIINSSSEIRFNANPNPVRDKAVIEFEIPEPANIKLAVYNLMGIMVQTITDDNYSAGSHTLEMNTHNIESGIYLCKIEVTYDHQEYSKMIKMVVSK